MAAPAPAQQTSKTRAAASPRSMAAHTPRRAAPAPGTLARLHRAAGNRTIHRLLHARRIQRACGPAPITAAVGGRAACTDNFDRTFVAGIPFRFKKDCDEFQPGHDGALTTLATLLPASTTFEIHGFASVDGPAAFNQDLGCARGMAARDLLTGAGIAASRITGIINHGPVPGPAADRRSVVVLASVHTITSQTVVADPAPRSRTTIGVGEQVDLTHAPGSATWTATAGTLSAATGVTVTLTAPDTAQRITVTASAATLSFDVVQPTLVRMDRQPGTGVKHTFNQPDSGIQTRVFLGPDTVNFSRARYRELDVTGTPSPLGTYACNPFSTGHCSGAVGSACADKALTTTVVAGMGTQSVLGDCAYSGDCGGSPPFAPGFVMLVIPYQYRVGTGPFRAITSVVQLHTLATDASTLTTSKAGASGSTTVASPTLTLVQCP